MSHLRNSSRIQSSLLFVLTFTIFSATSAVSEEGDPEFPQGPVLRDTPDPASGDLLLFPGTISSENYGGGSGRSLPQGWNIPGRHYKPGSGWWVLACKGQCTLTSSNLTVTPSTHPDYDGPLLMSQFLRWAPMPYGLDVPPVTGGRIEGTSDSPVLLAIFKPLRSLEKLSLREGPIKTWLHSGMASYPASRPSAMNVLIDMREAGNATLIPKVSEPPTPVQPWEREQREPYLVFELRSEGKRQRLGSYNWHMGARTLKGQDYLIWAGDLDGDGKLDLLMNFTDYYWGTTLFLSSLAKPGELVGVAGQFNYSPPDSPGC